MIALPCLLYSMDLTVLHLARARAQRGPAARAAPSCCGSSTSTASWSPGSLITMGTLGDRIGRRRLLLIGAARVRRRLGAGGVLDQRGDADRRARAARDRRGDAGALDALADPQHVPGRPQQRTVAIGVWITSFSAGARDRPAASAALLLECFWWGSVFLLAVPVMALLLVRRPAAAARVPRPRRRPARPGRARRCRWRAVLAVIYGLKQIAAGRARRRPRRCRSSAALAVGARVRAPPAAAGRPADRPARCSARRAFSAALGRQHARLLRRVRHRRLHRPVPAAGARAVAARGGAAGAVPAAAGFIVGSHADAARSRAASARRRDAPAGSSLARRRLRRCSTQVGGDRRPGGSSWPASVLFSLGLAPAVHPGHRPDRRSAPPERAGAASGISETSSELGGALGIAILGTIGTAVYREQMADALPAECPPEAAETARDTLGGAVAVAERLPQLHAADVLEPPARPSPRPSRLRPR